MRAAGSRRALGGDALELGSGVEPFDLVVCSCSCTGTAGTVVCSYRFGFRFGFCVRYGRDGSGTVRACPRACACNHFGTDRGLIRNRFRYRFGTTFGTTPEPANRRKYALSRASHLSSDLVRGRVRVLRYVRDHGLVEPGIRRIVDLPIVHDESPVGPPIEPRSSLRSSEERARRRPREDREVGRDHAGGFVARAILEQLEQRPLLRRRPPGELRVLREPVVEP